jgi:[lysine-biosynthesis-protein LysW]---L-2-aminoadipate ligase
MASVVVEDLSIGILYDRIRWEEKEIGHQLELSGSSPRFIDSKSLTLAIEGSSKSLQPLPSVILERCVSFYRGMSIAAILEGKGLKTINSSGTLSLCGNKLLTSLQLSKEGLPTPRTILAFSPDSALKAIEEIGYPCVMKPVVGSWGRQVIAVRDRETAEAFIELREQEADSMQSIFYIQEMVERPPRDIRCITVGNEIVASVYRYASPDSWKTNVALGGRTEYFRPSPELTDLVQNVSIAMGGGILGIDLMENRKTGNLVVHEVNGTVEFKGAQAATSHSIANKIARYSLGLKKEWQPEQAESKPAYEFMKTKL